MSESSNSSDKGGKTSKDDLKDVTHRLESEQAGTQSTVVSDIFAPAAAVVGKVEAEENTVAKLKDTEAVKLDMHSPEMRKKLEEYIRLNNPDLLGKENFKMPHGDKVIAILAFTMIGLVGLFPWNSVTNIIYDVAHFLFQNGTLEQNIVVVYQTSNLALMFYVLFVGGMTPKVCVICALLFSVNCIVLGIIFQFGLNLAGTVFFYIFAVTISLIVGLLNPSAFAMAAIIPFDLTRFISLGYGFAGVLSFGLFQLGDKVFFTRTVTAGTPDNTPENSSQLQRSLWFMEGLAAAFCLVAAGLLFTLMRKDWFHERSKIYYQKAKLVEKMEAIELTDEEDDLLPVKYRKPRNIMEFLRDTWLQYFNNGFTLLITLILFPLVAPLAFCGPGPIYNGYNVGMFQIGDLIGRYMPFMPFVEKLNPPPGYLWIPTVLRLVFIPLFAFPVVYNDTAFNTIAYQYVMMLLFAISNGWIVTQANVNVPNCVERIREKGKVGTGTSVVTSTSVLIGVYISRGLQPGLSQYNLNCGLGGTVP